MNTKVSAPVPQHQNERLSHQTLSTIPIAQLSNLNSETGIRGRPAHVRQLDAHAAMMGAGPRAVQMQSLAERIRHARPIPEQKYISTNKNSSASTLQPKLIPGGADIAKDVWDSVRGWPKSRQMIHAEEEYHKEDIVTEIELLKTRNTQGYFLLLTQVIEDNGNAGAMTIEAIRDEILKKQNYTRANPAPTTEVKKVEEFLAEPESYTVATFANAKAKGALGHHIFIAYEDGTVSEWAGPETKAYYPRSQEQTRTVTRGAVARVKMSARHHGMPGRGSRYFRPADGMRYARFQGYLYAPWYQDCFHWVDKVLTDAGQPVNTSLNRIQPGAVGLWGTLLVAVVATAALLLPKKT
jgi:hypothetical protein